MNETPVIPEAPKKNNTALIIGIVAVVVVLCCCCLAAVALYQYGDQLLNLLDINF